MADMQAVEKTVGNVLKERHPGLPIEEIRVEPSLDMDGDEVLRIAVVYDGTKRRPDPPPWCAT